MKHNVHLSDSIVFSKWLEFLLDKKAPADSYPTICTIITEFFESISPERRVALQNIVLKWFTRMCNIDQINTITHNNSPTGTLKSFLAMVYMALHLDRFYLVLKSKHEYVDDSIETLLLLGISPQQILHFYGALYQTPQDKLDDIYPMCQNPTYCLQNGCSHCPHKDKPDHRTCRYQQQLRTIENCRDANTPHIVITVSDCAYLANKFEYHDTDSDFESVPIFDDIFIDELPDRLITKDFDALEFPTPAAYKQKLGILFVHHIGTNPCFPSPADLFLCTPANHKIGVRCKHCRRKSNENQQNRPCHFHGHIFLLIPSPDPTFNERDIEDNRLRILRRQLLDSDNSTIYGTWDFHPRYKKDPGHPVVIMISPLLFLRCKRIFFLSATTTKKMCEEWIFSDYIHRKNDPWTIEYVLKESKRFQRDNHIINISGGNMGGVKNTSRIVHSGKFFRYLKLQHKFDFDAQHLIISKKGVLNNSAESPYKSLRGHTRPWSDECGTAILLKHMPNSKGHIINYPVSDTNKHECCTDVIMLGMFYLPLSLQDIYATYFDWDMVKQLHASYFYQALDRLRTIKHPDRIIYTTFDPPDIDHWFFTKQERTRRNKFERKLRKNPNMSARELMKGIKGDQHKMTKEIIEIKKQLKHKPGEEDA